jgi:hypothetical protein
MLRQPPDVISRLSKPVHVFDMRPVGTVSVQPIQICDNNGRLR